MQLLDFVDGADGHRLVGGQRQTVRIRFGVQRAHVRHLLRPFSSFTDQFETQFETETCSKIGNGMKFGNCLEVDVAEDEFMVGRVDDGGPVRAGEHVHRRLRAERPQHGRLRTQRHLRAKIKTRSSYRVSPTLQTEQRPRGRNRSPKRG